MREIEVFEAAVKKDIKIKRLSLERAVQLFQNIMLRLRRDNTKQEDKR